MTLFTWLQAACGATLLLLCVDGASEVDLKLDSTQVTLTADALDVAVMVTPKQPKLKKLTLETLVDTSGTVVLSGLVRCIRYDGLHLDG